MKIKPIEMTDLAKKLRTIRVKFAKTQNEMAEMLGIGVCMYQKYESGDAEPKGIKLKKYIQSIEKIENENAPQLRSFSKEPKARYAKAIPFYDVDVSASNVEMFDDKPEIPSLRLSIPGFEDCNFAIPVFGHSMWPTYENGIIVICKKITDLDLIAYGEAHLIITDEQRLLKRILRSEKQEHILAVSDNEEVRKDQKRKYDNFDIPKSKIRKLYLVKGCVKRNQI